MNIMIISGNCGADMEVRTTPAGKSIGSFSVPVKQGYGEYEKTSWVKCLVLGDKRVNSLQPIILKGLRVTVSGEFYMDEWEKDGVKHQRPAMIVDNVEFVSVSSSVIGQGPNPSPQMSPNQGMPDTTGFDDDIPFSK